jgi:hypothetical protein
MVEEGYVVEEEGNVVLVDCGIIPRSSKYLANDRFESVKSRIHSPEFLSVSLNIWENCWSKGRKLRANQKYLKTPRRKMVISEFLPGVFPGIENSSTVRFGLRASPPV